MGLSCTVSRIKIAYVSQARVFCAPAEGVPLELGIDAWGQKNWKVGATKRKKKFNNIFSRMDTIHERDRKIVRQTDTDGHWAIAKTALIRIASRGKINGK